MAAINPDTVKLDEASQKEISTFLEQEQGKARMQSSIHNFTSMCWDKCVTSTPSTKFSSYESSCLTNCVGRFLDTSLYMVQRIEDQRAQAGLH